MELTTPKLNKLLETNSSRVESIVNHLLDYRNADDRVLVIASQLRKEIDVNDRKLYEDLLKMTPEEFFREYEE